MASAIASSQTQTITNIAFGFAATGLSILTIWQGRRAWRVWQSRSSNTGACTHTQLAAIRLLTSITDLELGPVSSSPNTKTRNSAIRKFSQLSEAEYSSPQAASGLTIDVSYTVDHIIPDKSISPLDLHDSKIGSTESSESSLGPL